MKTSLAVTALLAVLAAHGPASSASAGSWGGQLGAFSSESQAREGIETLRRRHPQRLSGMPLTIEVVVVNGQSFHRVVAGPHATREAADGFCATMKAQAQPCIVRRMEETVTAPAVSAAPAPASKVAAASPPSVPVPAPVSPPAERDAAIPVEPLYGSWVGGDGKCGRDFVEITRFQTIIHRNGQAIEAMTCEITPDDQLQLLACEDGSIARFHVRGTDEVMLLDIRTNAESAPAVRNQTWRRCSR